MIQIKIKNWYADRGAIWGDVYGSYLFKKGQFIHTSTVEYIDVYENKMVITTVSGSRYACIFAEMADSSRIGIEESLEYFEAKGVKITRHN